MKQEKASRTKSQKTNLSAGADKTQTFPLRRVLNPKAEIRNPKRIQSTKKQMTRTK
jgi:hypothetical protein